jgi:hypothetical protein
MNKIKFVAAFYRHKCEQGARDSKYEYGGEPTPVWTTKHDKVTLATNTVKCFGSNIKYQKLQNDRQITVSEHLQFNKSLSHFSKFLLMERIRTIK